MATVGVKVLTLQSVGKVGECPVIPRWRHSVAGGRRLVEVFPAAHLHRWRHRLERSAGPAGREVAGGSDEVPSVDGRRDVVVDGRDVGRGGRGRGRGGVVVAERVGVVFERDAHRLPVVDGRRAGHVARCWRHATADLVRLTVNRRQRLLAMFTAQRQLLYLTLRYRTGFRHLLQISSTSGNFILLYDAISLYVGY